MLNCTEYIFGLLAAQTVSRIVGATVYTVTVSLSSSTAYCSGSTITWQPCCCFDSLLQRGESEQRVWCDTHCCPSAATMEGPWSKVLNPPLLEWSCTGLNSKLRVSTHVTLPLPSLHPTPSLRCCQLVLMGKLGLHRNTAVQKWKHGNMQETVDLKNKQTNGAANGLIIWKVNLIRSLAEGVNGNYEPVQTWR